MWSGLLRAVEPQVDDGWEEEEEGQEFDASDDNAPLDSEDSDSAVMARVPPPPPEEDDLVSSAAEEDDDDDDSQQQQQQAQQRPPPVAKMFMGRLTQFLEHVAPHEEDYEEEEEQGDGWGEDDNVDVDLEDEDEQQYDPPNNANDIVMQSAVADSRAEQPETEPEQQPQQQQSRWAMMSAGLRAVTSPLANTNSALQHYFDGDEEDNEGEEEANGWNEDSLDLVEEDVSREEEPALVAEEEQHAYGPTEEMATDTAGDGWGDDEDIAEDIVDSPGEEERVQNDNPPLSPNEEEETEHQPRPRPEHPTDTSLDMSESDDHDDEAISSIAHFGSALSQPLNSLLTEIREMDSGEVAAATNEDMDPNGEPDEAPRPPTTFSQEDLAAAALQPLADIDEPEYLRRASVTDTDAVDVPMTEEPSTPQDGATSASVAAQPAPESLNSSVVSADDPYTQNMRQSVDNVLSEIRSQEQLSLQRAASAAEAAEAAAANAMATHSSPAPHGSQQNLEALVHDLDQHHDAAVKELQQEMQQAEQLPTKEIVQLQKQQQRIVDHMPPIGTSEGNDTGGIGPKSLEPQLEEEDRTRDTGKEGNDEDVYEDENEDDFGLVVDHTPPLLPRPHRATSTESDANPNQNAAAAASSMIVQATDWEQDMKADDAMDETVDEEGGDDDGGWNEEEDELDQLSKDEEQLEQQPQQPAVVDHTPNENGGQDNEIAPGDPSVMALVPSEDEGGTFGGDDEGGIFDAEDDYDDDNNVAFGPVVDLIPPGTSSSHGGGAPSASQSLAVNANTLEEDFQQDDAMDETTTNAWLEDDDFDDDDDDTDGLNDDTDLKLEFGQHPRDAGDEGSNERGPMEQREQQQPPTSIIDHTPVIADHHINSGSVADPSVAVLEDETEAGGDDPSEFGLVVDHLPSTKKPGPMSVTTNQSLAVNAALLEEDFQQDDAMDETVNAWGDLDDADFGDLEEAALLEENENDAAIKNQEESGGTAAPTADSTTAALEEPTVVDSLPTMEHRRSADPSVMALPSEGGASIMEDLLEGDGTEVDGDEPASLLFGPVVDHLPSAKKAVAPVSVTTAQSLAVNAAALEEDFQQDDAMDETVNAWGDDDLDDLDALGTEDATAPSASVDEKNESKAAEPTVVVDHTPRPMEHRCSGSADPSLVVLDGDDENEDGDDDVAEFGPVVDQLPSTTEKPPPSAATSQSLAVNATALEEDFQQDDAMDETVVDYEADSIIELAQRGLATEKDEEADEIKDGWGEVEVDVEIEVGEEDHDGTDPQAAAPSNTPYIIPPASDAHVVDATPSQLNFTPDPTRSANPSASVVALAATEDLTRDTGAGSNEDVYDDENELAFVKVVDHTPTVDDENEITPGSYNSIAAHAPSVLDEGTAFGDSTVAGGTTLGDEDGALDQSLEMVPAKEQKAEEAREETMVDHTPSEMLAASVGNRTNDPSVVVLQSIDENDSNAEDEENPALYGPMVDLIPAGAPAHPVQSRSDSVVAQVNDVDTLVGTIGDTIEGDEGDGDDTIVDDEMPADLPGPGPGDAALQEQADEDHLVDFVPPQPESRFGDASTVAAADPSEVLSAGVDDIMFEGGEDAYGPVVDQLPTLALPSVLSGAGSTAVAPPSVATDLDLDPDETDGHGVEEDGWDHEDPIIEESPNPQSGNDEPLINEQLVDFLPPNPPPQGGDGEGEQGGPSTEVSSEYAVDGGAQSLLQAEDTREDDYGPVVDQIPSRSAAVRSTLSVSSTVATSEIGRMEKEDVAEEAEAAQLEAAAGDGAEQDKNPAAKVVVDHVPSIRDLRGTDSLATLGQSQFTAEDEEEETDSKFGPVVDHLPTPSPSAPATSSMAASRGGSTVDALGNISEGSAGDETDGWADDFDLDESDAASDRTDRVSQSATKQPSLLFRRSSAGDSSDRANISVRFDASVRDNNQPNESHNETVYFDARGVTTTTTTSAREEAEATQYFDAETGAQKPGSSFAEAETPPSTPHHRPGITTPGTTQTPWLDLSALKMASGQQKPPTQYCTPCAGSQDGECPCVKKLLNVNKEAGSLFGTLVDSRGTRMEVDFGQMLEDEMVKRRLLEEEAKALRELSGAHAAMSEELEELTRKLNQQRLERDNLHSQNATLHAQVVQKDQTIAKMKLDMKGLDDKVQTIQEQSDENLSKSQDKEDSLHNQILSHRAQITELHDAESRAMTELAQSKRVVSSLQEQVSELVEELDLAQKEKGDLASADAALIDKLRADRAADAKMCDELRVQVESLENEIREVQAAAERQKSDHSVSMQENEQRFEAEREALVRSAKDAAHQIEMERVAHQHLQDEVSHLHEKLTIAQKSATENQSANAIVLALQTKLQNEQKAKETLNDELSRAKAESFAQLKQNASSVSSLQKDLDIKTAECDKVIADFIAVSDTLKSTQEDMSRERVELKLKGQEDLHAVEAQLQQLHNELDTFKLKLQAAEQQQARTAVRLKQVESENLDAVAKLAEKETELVRLQESTQKQLENARSSNQQLSNDLVKSRAEGGEHLRKLLEIEKEHQTEVKKQTAKLEERDEKLQRLELSLRQLEASKASAEVDSSSKYRSLMLEKEKLAHQLSSVSRQRDSLQDKVSERKEAATSLRRHIDEHGTEEKALELKREDEMARLSAEVKDLKSSLSTRNSDIATLRASLSELQQQRSSMSNQISELSSTCLSLETRASLAESSLKKEEAKASNSISEVQTLRATTSSLREQLVSAESNKTGQIQEFENLQEELNALRTVSAHQAEHAAHLEHELSEARQRVHELEVGRSNQNESFERISDEKVRYEQLVHRNEKYVASLQQECEKMRQQLQDHSSLQLELVESKQKLDAACVERDALTDENEELLVQLGLFKERMDAADDKFVMVAHDLRNLDSVCEEVSSQYGGTWPVKQKEIEGPMKKSIQALRALHSRVAELESQLQATKSDNERLATSEQQRSQSAAASLEARCERLEQEGNAKQAEVDRLMEFETQSKGLQSQLASLDAHCKWLEQENKDQKAQVDRLAHFETSSQNMQSQIATLQARLDDLESESRLQRLTIASKDAEIESAESRLSKVLQNDEAVGALDERVRELEAHNRALRVRAEDSETALQLFQSRTEHGQMQEQTSRQSLEAQVQTLQAQLNSQAVTLQESHTMLAAKDEEIRELAGLSESRHQNNNPASSYNGGEGGESTAELRSHIISLATALERSELLRAEAMDREALVLERNADTVRQLRDQVKIFYSSVSSHSVV